MYGCNMVVVGHKTPPSERAGNNGGKTEGSERMDPSLRSG